MDPEACTGCGLRASVCPTGALETQAPTNLALLQRVVERATEEDSLAFTCTRYLEARGKAAEAGVQVNCLGRLDESILVGAVAWGAKDLPLVDGACQGCPAGTSLPFWPAKRERRLAPRLERRWAQKGL